MGGCGGESKEVFAPLGIVPEIEETGAQEVDQERLEKGDSGDSSGIVDTLQNQESASDGSSNEFDDVVGRGSISDSGTVAGVLGAESDSLDSAQAGYEVVESGDEQEIGEESDGLFDPGSFMDDALRFPLGVQSGDVNAQNAVLWTRYLGNTDLKLVVFEDGYEENPGIVVLEAPATIKDGGFVHVEVSGLEAYTNYRYCFYEVGEEAASYRSVIGLLRTAPASDEALPLVFGAASCINDNFMPYDTLEQAGSDDLDFFILAGDIVYADGSESLKDYRTVWGEAFADPGFQKLFRTTPTYSTWDDHEVDNNWNPELIDSGKLEVATQSFFDFLAIREPEVPNRVWRSYRWGKTAEIFLLDCRSERRNSEGVYISEEQMNWLKESLSSSDAVFKIIVNSVPVTDMPFWYVAENDRWEGFPGQREEILSFIEEEVEGALWLTGDFHFGGIMKIGSPGSTYDEHVEVMVGPAAQFPNPLWVGVQNAVTVQGQFPFLTGTLNYTRFTLDPISDPPSVLVEFVTGSGSIVHATTLRP